MYYTKEKIEQLRHRWTTAKGKKLINLIKKSRCYLSPVLFREKVHNFPGINDEELDQNIDLRGAPLSGFDFRVKIADGDNFTEQFAILSNIHFEGASLKSCNFKDSKLYECSFDHADLTHAEFSTATINGCSFEEADLNGVNFRGTKLINCNFSNSIIKDIVLDNTIIDGKTNFGKKIHSEKNGNYHFASIEYKQIKEMYKNSSLHSLADEYHYKEMVAKRKTASRKNPKRWLNYFFGDLLCKYGTSFFRVILWSLVLIVGCAILYQSTESLVYQSSAINPTFATSLYFSLVSFTTLGFGDYHATGAMRFLAAIESFLGASLIALFTVIVARNIIRD